MQFSDNTLCNVAQISKSDVSPVSKPAEFHLFVFQRKMKTAATGVWTFGPADVSSADASGTLARQLFKFEP